MVSNIISSSQNPRVKYYNALKKKRIREKENKMILEGPRLIEEAIRRNINAEAIFYENELQPTFQNLFNLIASLNSQTLFFPVTRKVLNQMAATENPQGILAIFLKPEYIYEGIFARPTSLIILVDQLQEPGNLGTIIRTAAAAGAGGLLFTKGTVDPYNPKAVRSTMGGLFYMPVVPIQDLSDCLNDLRRRRFRLVVTDLRAERLYTEINYSSPTVIAFGNENRGISPVLYGAADELVRIPLLRPVESLNVAVSAGIMIYEVVRQQHLLQVFRKEN